MAPTPHLFDRLEADLTVRLSSSRTRTAAVGWAETEPALAGIRTALDAATRCRDRTADGGGRPALAALIRQGGDRLALDAALWGVLPVLRSVAAGLGRAWGAERVEIDQAVAAAAWAVLVGIAGRDLTWPDRTVAGRVRVTVRDQLRADARHAHREGSALPGDDLPVRSETGSAALAADLLRRAVDRGEVSEQAAALVWATRVAGLSPQAAGNRCGRSPKAVTMTCLRAERVLRSRLAGVS